MTDEKTPENTGPEKSAEELANQPEGDQPQGEQPEVNQAEGNQPEANQPEEEVKVAVDEAEEQSEEGTPKAENEDDAAEEDAEAEMLKMLDGLPDESGSTNPEDIDFGNTSVADAEFQQLSEPAAKNDPRNIEMLLDVSLPVAIELGRTKMAISEILALGPGSVVELNKLAGEPIDVLVNNKPVAKGEVVVVDENFGVRVTQLLTPEERLRAIAHEE